MSTSWVTRWKYSIAAKSTAPGIWKLETGGYLVRTKNGMKALRGASLAEAKAARLELLKPKVEKISHPLFSDFAVSLFEERIVRNKIESAATRERWEGALRLYLLPSFQGKRIDEIDVVGLTMTMAHWIAKGKPSFKDPKKNVDFAPSTANSILRILRTICNVAHVRFKLAHNPWGGAEFFPEGVKYTVEEPNAIPPAVVSKFLGIARKEYPQHYGMMLLGFMTGLRPSSLRALRKFGDIDWANNQIHVRRSASRGQEIMGKTKTGKAITISLPQVIMDVLWDHLQAMEPGSKQRESEYLFPSTKGGIRARSVLDAPFKDIAAKLGVTYTVSPRAMRRSFQDLARAAKIGNVVTRSISGHQTESMQEHYSTAWAPEQREALENLYDMVNK